MNSAETTCRFFAVDRHLELAAASPGIGFPFLSTTCASTMTSSTPDLNGGLGRLLLCAGGSDDKGEGDARHGACGLLRGWTVDGNAITPRGCYS